MDDMEFAHKTIKGMCGGALCMLLEGNLCGPERVFISSASYLDDWIDGKTFESQSNFIDTNNDAERTQTLLPLIRRHQ